MVGDSVEESVKESKKENIILFSDEDTVTSNVREIFKKYSNKYPKTFWVRLGQRNLRLIYQYWLLHKKLGLEFNWLIRREFLYPDETEWNNYLIRFLTSSGIIISEDMQSFLIEGKKRILIEKAFEAAFKSEAI